MFDAMNPLIQWLLNKYDITTYTPFILGGLYTITIGGVIYLLNYSKEDDEIEEDMEINIDELYKQININTVNLISMRNEHNALSESILDNNDEINELKKQIAFRFDMRRIEGEDMRSQMEKFVKILKQLDNRMNNIENNLIISYSDSENEN